MDKNLLKIIPFVKQYKPRVFLNILFNVLYALFNVISFIALVPLLEVLFKETDKVYKKPVYTSIFEIDSYGKDLLYYNITKLSENDGAEYALLLAVSLIIVSFLLKNLFGYLANTQLMHLKNNILRDMRMAMYQKIIRLPVSYFSEKRKGDIMARMLGDVNEVQHSFFAILSLIVREPMTIIFAIATMVMISFKLTIFVFIFIPVSGFIISRIGKTLKAKSERLQAEGGQLISIVDETLSGLKIVKSYNAENSFINKFKNSLIKILSLSNNIGNKNNAAGPLSEFMGIVVIAVILWYGGKMVLVDGTLESAKFITYMGLSYAVLTPAKAITKASYTVKTGIAAAKRVFEVMEVENATYDRKNNTKIGALADKIELKNVSFAYEKESVLKDFSLVIPKGKAIALVGQSGSGKSTIANLLSRFYDIENGSITIDGVELRDINLASLRSNIGMVTQDSVLFNDTIKGNLLIAKPDATDNEIIEALKVSNSWEFVNKLPESFNTNIGEGGGKLSGGQKQRLSIARAVLKNAPIMVLDEATSALDTESERLVQDALEKLMKNRTSVVIAHRLSTIKNSDLIVVMREGRIVEQGTHDELIAKNGNYKLLVDMQALS